MEINVDVAETAHFELHYLVLAKSSGCSTLMFLNLCETVAR